MKLEKYHELFQAQVEVPDEVGVTIEDESLVLVLQKRMVGKFQMNWTAWLCKIKVW